jgi:ABC-type dipeptide/oligopeptide/nickel transport system permease subunit
MILLFACLGAVSWLNMARIVRGQILSLRSRPFILASQLLGARPRFILLRHLLPNVTGVVIVYATLTLPAVILYESFLSFLGMGIRPPDASLGTLIEDGARQLNPIQVHWWLLVFPCGLLTLALLALQFLGDGLRDAFEPRSET